MTRRKYEEEIYDLCEKPFHLKSYNGLTSNPIFLSSEFYFTNKLSICCSYALHFINTRRLECIFDKPLLLLPRSSNLQTYDQQVHDEVVYIFHPVFGVNCAKIFRWNSSGQKKLTRISSLKQSSVLHCLIFTAICTNVFNPVSWLKDTYLNYISLLL